MQLLIHVNGAKAGWVIISTIVCECNYLSIPKLDAGVANRR